MSNSLDEKLSERGHNLLQQLIHDGLLTAQWLVEIKNLRSYHLPILCELTEELLYCEAFRCAEICILLCFQQEYPEIDRRVLSLYCETMCARGLFGNAYDLVLQIGAFRDPEYTGIYKSLRNRVVMDWEDRRPSTLTLANYFAHGSIPEEFTFLHRDLRVATGPHGRGLFATHDITQGTTVLIDCAQSIIRPTADNFYLSFISWFCVLQRHPELLHRFASLYHDQRDIPLNKEQVDALLEKIQKLPSKEFPFLKRDHASLRSWLSRFYRNALPIDQCSEDPEHWAVFPYASSFNHSCTPNVARHHVDKYTVIFYAKDTIRCGQELTISYVSPFAHVVDRSQVLRSHYNIKCQCPRCMNPHVNEIEWLLSGFFCSRCGERGVRDRSHRCRESFPPLKNSADEEDEELEPNKAHLEEPELLRAPFHLDRLWDEISVLADKVVENQATNADFSSCFCILQNALYTPLELFSAWLILKCQVNPGFKIWEEGLRDLGLPRDLLVKLEFFNEIRGYPTLALGNHPPEWKVKGQKSKDSKRTVIVPLNQSPLRVFAYSSRNRLKY